MGGTSSERAVSLKTGQQIVAALDSAKYEVAAIDTQDVLALSARKRQGIEGKEGGTKKIVGKPERLQTRQNTNALITDTGQAKHENLSQRPTPDTRHPVPDLVFIALHGKGGEDGTVQGMLELLGLPYTGSGVLASALAMDKAQTKRLFRAEHIPVIDDVTVTRQQMREGADLVDTVQIHLGGFPVFVKPNGGRLNGGRLARDPAGRIDTRCRKGAALTIRSPLWKNMCAASNSRSAFWAIRAGPA